MFVVLIMDRHSDPNVKLFEHYDTAHTFAQRFAHEYSLDGKYETNVYERYGTVYSYSPEGDRLVVLERNPHKTLAEAMS